MSSFTAYPSVSSEKAEDRLPKLLVLTGPYCCLQGHAAHTSYTELPEDGWQLGEKVIYFHPESPASHAHYKPLFPGDQCCVLSG